MDGKKLADAVRRALPPRYCSAVIVAAGSATRMGGIDKVMAELGGEPMIVRTVRAFQQCAAIREIVIVTREDLIRRITGLCVGVDKVRAVIAGGDSRAASVRRGLNALSEETELAAVHDGARPLVTPELIDRVVRAADHYGAAIPVIPVKDTIKAAPKGLVLATPDRSKLVAAQTPQIFDFDLLRGAMQKAEETGAAGIAVGMGAAIASGASIGLTGLAVASGFFVTSGAAVASGAQVVSVTRLSSGVAVG